MKRQIRINQVQDQKLPTEFTFSGESGWHRNSHRCHHHSAHRPVLRALRVLRCSISNPWCILFSLEHKNHQTTKLSIVFMFSYVSILFSDINKISHLSLSLRPMKRDHCWVFRSLSIQWQWPHKKAVESDFEYRHSIATVWRFIAILFLIGLTQLGKTLGIVFFAMVAHALGFLLPVGRAGSVMPCIL